MIINPKAGSVNAHLIKEKISTALFRCDLQFYLVSPIKPVEDFISQEINCKTNVFVVCGGDGTINFTLQALLKLNNKTSDLPAFCLIKSGTANDLAHQMGVSYKIERAARQILEGRHQAIDILEVISQNEKKYMLTNGGIGIPAMAAERANQLRHILQGLAKNQYEKNLSYLFSNLAYKVIKKIGSKIYSIILIQSILKWRAKNWQFEIGLSNGARIVTDAEFILINNQPITGQKYVTAPYTVNNDGLVNLLLIQASSVLAQLLVFFKVATESLKESKKVKSFETSGFNIRSLHSSNRFSFFGDGEILFKDIAEVQVNCLKRQLNLVVSE
ncbi:MAG: diacylglycerol/lipid kinase family protein [Pseudobdellovibrionaceae bacterium]